MVVVLEGRRRGAGVILVHPQETGPQLVRIQYVLAVVEKVTRKLIAPMNWKGDKSWQKRVSKSCGQGWVM